MRQHKRSAVALVLGSLALQLAYQPASCYSQVLYNRKTMSGGSYFGEGQVFETIRNPSGSYSPYYVEVLNTTPPSPVVMTANYYPVTLPDGSIHQQYSHHFHTFTPLNTSNARRAEARQGTYTVFGMSWSNWTSSSIGP